MLSAPTLQSHEQFRAYNHWQFHVTQFFFESLVIKVDFLGAAIDVQQCLQANIFHIIMALIIGTEWVVRTFLVRQPFFSTTGIAKSILNIISFPFFAWQYRLLFEYKISLWSKSPFISNATWCPSTTNVARVCCSKDSRDVVCCDTCACCWMDVGTTPTTDCLLLRMRSWRQRRCQNRTTFWSCSVRCTFVTSLGLVVYGRADVNKSTGMCVVSW